MRKTVGIKQLVQEANRMLMVTPDDYVGQRKGIAALLESALHEAGAYRGFQYISQHDRNNFASLSEGDTLLFQRGLSVGIERPDGPDTTPKFPDETRRRYILDSRIA